MVVQFPRYSLSGFYPRVRITETPKLSQLGY